MLALVLTLIQNELYRLLAYNKTEIDINIIYPSFNICRYTVSS